MILSTLLLLQAVSAPLPSPLSETHMRDIGCVATLAIVADDQRRGAAPSLRFPNVMERGRVYAGVVGQRVMDETGQTKEVIALAIRQSAQDQQAALTAAENAKEQQLADAKGASAKLNEFTAPCLELLDNEVPAKAPTPDDYRFCAAIIMIAVDEIETSEGSQSINAKVMRWLAEQLTQKYQDARFPPGSPLPALSTHMVIARDIDREIVKQRKLAKESGGLEGLSKADGAAKYQRCVFLGE